MDGGNLGKWIWALMVCMAWVIASCFGVVDYVQDGDGAYGIDHESNGSLIRSFMRDGGFLFSLVQQ